jgi:hypothetical protein
MPCAWAGAAGANRTTVATSAQREDSDAALHEAFTSIGIDSLFRIKPDDL